MIAALLANSVTDCIQLYPTFILDVIHTSLCLLECLAEVLRWRTSHCTGTSGRQRTQILASLNLHPQLKPSFYQLCPPRA